MVNTADLRVVKTRKAIKEAFLKILGVKSYEKITIKDIASEALINRNTFYLHYLDKEDLIEHLTGECFSKLENSISLSNLSDDTIGLSYELLKRSSVNMFRTLEEDFYFYKLILGDESIPYLSTRFNTVIKDHITGGAHAPSGEIYVEYIVSGLVGVVKYWLKNPQQYSIEELTDMIIELYSNDVIELLKNK